MKLQISHKGIRSVIKSSTCSPQGFFCRPLGTWLNLDLKWSPEK